ncbi:MAG TPA: hypothetical protein VFO25_08260 [Candidatus Eremiobacteraceae bacterium]|nr:hypothetical protein [Candidatus Eremiobacteraceae bacterium]
MYQSRLVLLAAGVVLAISMASVAGAASSNVVIVDPGVNATPADVDSQHNLQTKTCDPTTGTHCAAIDSNGSQQVKICDTTTSGQCATVTSNHDIDVKVDDNGSLIQLQDGSGTRAITRR